MKPVIFFACAMVLSGQQGGNPNFYSIEKEITLGDQLAAEVQRNVTVIPGGRVDKLGAALVPKTSPFQYRFRTFDSTQPVAGPASGAAMIDEAVAIPGGWIFVPQSVLARDERQVAAILAHAIAHIELRHGTQLATRKELIQIGHMATAMPQSQGQLSTSAGLLRLQRAYELAADLQAVQLLRAAGMDPASYIEYLRTLPAGDHPDFSAVPDPQQRIDAAQKAIAAPPR